MISPHNGIHNNIHTTITVFSAQQRSSCLTQRTFLCALSAQEFVYLRAISNHERAALIRTKFSARKSPLAALHSALSARPVRAVDVRNGP